MHVLPGTRRDVGLAVACPGMLSAGEEGSLCRALLVLGVPGKWPCGLFLLLVCREDCHGTKQVPEWWQPDRSCFAHVGRHLCHTSGVCLISLGGEGQGRKGST